MDILRVAGAPGVGKSTVAEVVARRLADEGVPTGLLDMDQLGMLYPAPEDDPDRWHLKETALARVVPRYRDAGVERLVVSGVADADSAPPDPGGPTCSLWLDADAAQRRFRLSARGEDEARMATTVAIGTAEAARAHPAWVRIETDGLPVSVVADQVMARWTCSATPDARVAAPRTTTARGRVLWMTGPRLAGASRIGWEIASGLWRAGRRSGFADAAQLALTWNADSPALDAVAELHAVFAEAGAGVFVVVAPFEIPPHAVVSAFPAADVSVVRLDADKDVRRDRAMKRRQGGGVSLAGDDLIGGSDADVERVVRQGTRESLVPPRDGEILLQGSADSASTAAAVRAASGI